MREELRILIVEDSAHDAELILRVLAKPDLQCVPCVVSNPLEFRRALAGTGPHLILSDYAMTGWDGMEALGIARELRPDIPFIFVSGAIGEEKVVEALQSGATDYVSKNNLHRLPNVINRAINEERERTGRQEAEEKLRQSHERFESVIASLRDVVWSIAVPSRELLYISLSMMTVYGHIIDEFYRGHVLWGDLIHPEDRKRVVAEWEKAIQVGFFDCQHRILLPTGEVRWIHNRGQGAYDNTGRVMRIDGVAMDSTEQHEQEEKIARLSRIHAVLIRISSSMLRFRDREGLFKEACQVAVEAGLFKMAWIGVIDPETLDGKPVAWAGAEDGFMQLTRLTARTGVPESERPGNRALREGRPIICNDIKTDAGLLAVLPDALARGYRSLAAFPLFVGRQPIGVLALFAAEPDFFDEEEIKLLTQLSGDISFALEYIDKEERLNYLAHYDPLTGLPNRTLFLDRLTQTLNMAKYADAKVFVAIGDIRRFRRVNSTFGKQAGDTLLREFAGRLNDLWPDKNGIARVSGDAFAGFVPEAKKPRETAFWFDRDLTSMLNKPFKVNEQEITVALTAGIAVYPTDGHEAETLYRNAEAALRRAKGSGEKYMFYQPEMTAKFEEALLLESKLRHAIEEEQFVLHYQPKVEVGSRNVTGLEALLRWNDPDTGMVLPGLFIPILEETGMVWEVGLWAIRKALQDSNQWRGSGIEPPPIAVNISSIQLQRKEFVDVVREALNEGKNAWGGLDFEITESLLMSNIEENISKLAAVRELGMNIAIDDFGTGYSSLAYLAHLPVSALKIDQSFIQTMTESPVSMTIVSTIISLAHSLNLKVIAEGVESAEQSKLLRLLKCDAMQGYFISRPLPSDRVLEFLAGQQIH